MFDYEYILMVVSIIALVASVTFIFWFIRVLNDIRALLFKIKDLNEWTYNLTVNINKNIDKNQGEKPIDDTFIVTEELTSDFETLTKVIGVTQMNENGENIQTLLKQIAPNTPLAFKAEPSNPNVPNLLNLFKVYANGVHIGYLNRELTGNIMYFLKNNPEFVLVGEIIEITGGFGKNKGCNIKIMFKNRY